MEATIIKMVASINLIVEMIKGIVPGLNKTWKIIVSFGSGVGVGLFFHLQGMVDNVYSAIILGLWSAAIASGLYEVVHNAIKDGIQQIKNTIK